MNEFYIALKKDCDHYASEESRKAVKIMVDVKNQIDRVRDSYCVGVKK